MKFQCQNFNSQPHEEADVNHEAVYDREVISTHSLTRRLTVITAIASMYSANFNSQPHEEADGVSSTGAAITCISTHSLTRRLTAILNKNHFI